MACLPAAGRRAALGGLAAAVGGLKLAASVLGGSAAASAPGPCGTTGVFSGAGPFTCTFTTVGSDVFIVPAGVGQADVVAVGAQGGHYFIAGDPAHGGSPAGDLVGRPGGAGGEATATVSLTPGDVVQVDVAGQGANGTAASRSGGMMNGPSGGQGALGGFGGSNGGVPGGAGDASGANGGTAFDGGNGSGGGGSSDVRVSAGGCASLSCGLGVRVLVAAGGGGGGGTGGQGNAIGGAGGDGGGPNGAPGGASVDGGNHGVPGDGATQTAGGAGGLDPSRHAPSANLNDPRLGGDGADGMLGAGGPGGVGNLPCTDPTLGGQCSATATTSGGGAGGGAGAGLYGGGGGSGGGGPFGGGGGAGGGGGGGSSLASGANAGSTSGANPGTINGGNGLVTITWSTRPQAVPTLSTAASESVPVGGQISDAGTLSGGDAPTGTITFRVYGPADTGCFTALATSTASVSGNGTYRSDPFSASAPGTYRWVASYAGDPGNAPAAGGCGDPAESVTVTAAPPPTTPTCAVTAIRRPGPSGSAEQDVTVSDPGGLASVSGIHIANGQVFTGGSAGTRIDAQPSTPLAGKPTSVVLTAVKATAGTITVWSFDATNAAGNTTHCA